MSEENPYLGPNVTAHVEEMQHMHRHSTPMMYVEASARAWNDLPWLLEAVAALRLLFDQAIHERDGYRKQLRAVHDLLDKRAGKIIPVLLLQRITALAAECDALREEVTRLKEPPR